MKIHNYFIFFIFLFFSNNLYSSELSFDEWLIEFQNEAIANGISKNTVNIVLSDAKFLPKVIKYDRYQPEFYEDTLTYIKKRTSKKKLENGIYLFKSNEDIIIKISNHFNVDKELLLSLMGIETNFGKYLGKMDIISSLATLSYDKRRRDFFKNELFTILNLIDQKIIDHKILYGSWAGAFGNFQFMPTSIEKYAIDYDQNKKIELKSIQDSFASAANYINSIGWDNNEPCFIKINLKNNVPSEFLNTSAKKIHSKKKLKYFKKYINNFDNNKINDNILSAIVTPDKDIIPDAETLKPAYLVFNNYELILKWNRSLRFALAVCTLKDSFKNEL